jgi:hypothetical protein
MTKVKAQISNECQMTNAKIYVHPFIQTQPTLVKMHNGKKIITDRFGKHFDIGVLDLI